MIKQAVAIRLSKIVCERCPDHYFCERCPERCQLRYSVDGLLETPDSRNPYVVFERKHTKAK
jgi:hypothetical protein